MRPILLLSGLMVPCLGLSTAHGLPVPPVPQYRLTDLSGPGWEASFAKAINSSGMVVGEAHHEHGEGLQAFSYHNGFRVKLGTLGGGVSDAHGVNDLGEIAGVSETDMLRQNRAFRYSNGMMMDLGTLGGGTSSGSDINNKGQIVGSADVSSSVRRAFLYENGQMVNLGSLSGPAGRSTGGAINSLGEVTGSSTIPGGGFHAFLYRNGQMNDIGRVGEPSVGNDINDAGQIVGNFNTPASETHAFLYTDGVMIDLDNSLGGTFAEAFGINSVGQIVGRAGTVGNAEIHAFLYEDGVMHDVNELLDDSGAGWTVTFAIKINDKGWIAANGSFEGGFNRALLLIPVPEPSSLLLVLGAAAAMLRYGGVSASITP